MSAITYRDPRSGFALPVAVFALIVVGVLVTTGFYMANQETKIGMASSQGTRAFYLAEVGMSDVMENWDLRVYRDLDEWTGTTTVEGTTPDGVWSVDVTKLDDYVYYLDSEATVTRGGLMAGATRRLGMTVRLTVPNIDPPAALTTRGLVELRGQAEIKGTDEVPNGWESICDAPGDDKPGVLTDDIDNVPDSSQISGTPRVQEDPTIDDETFTDFGDLDWDQLIAMATYVFGPGTINGTWPEVDADGNCDTSVETNWGDPDDPDGACGSHFPVIHIDGSATIQSGSRGQGILLVDGDLHLRGDFLFHGIIIVQGTFETEGAGNRVFGGVMASNANIEQTQLVGSSVVENSSCAIEEAIINNAAMSRPRALVQRSWVDLSALTN